jgi:hypothetical protein
MESVELNLPDLENLSVKELRQLITIVARQTTLKNYKHRCDAQRKCTSCGVTLCYACYNRHLVEKHGLEAAVFNNKMDNGSLMLPERREIKNKTTSSPRQKTAKVKKEKLVKTPWGKFTKAQLEQLLDALD